MSVAPYLPTPSSDRSPKTTGRSRRRRSEKLLSSHLSRPKIEPFPTQKLPRQLRYLLWLQKGISGISLALVIGALGTYASSIYIPKLWSRDYQQLKLLQRHERELTATNEALKNQIARQAEQPETGMTHLNPAHVLFLTPATNSPIRPSEKETTREETNLTIEPPLAY